MKKLETYYIERIGTEETDARDIIINIVSETEKNEYWSNKTKVDKTVNSKLYLFAKKNEKDRKLEDSKEEAKALESIEQYMKTGEYIRMLNDVRGRFVFSVDKYGLTGEDDKTANIPHLYKRHEYVNSGYSSFKKLKSKSRGKDNKALVQDSLYINY